MAQPLKRGIVINVHVDTIFYEQVLDSLPTSTDVTANGNIVFDVFNDTDKVQKLITDLLIEAVIKEYDNQQILKPLKHKHEATKES